MGKKKTKAEEKTEKNPWYLGSAIDTIKEREEKQKAALKRALGN